MLDNIGRDWLFNNDAVVRHYMRCATNVLVQSKMAHFDLHRDRAYPGGFPGNAWSSNTIMSRTTPTSGSMVETDQRGLAHTFSDSNELGVQNPTWRPTPAGGISSTPESNQAVHTHYIVDQRKRQANDVFKEELTWTIDFSKVSGMGGSAPTHHMGLSAVNRWLSSDDETAVQIGHCSTHTMLSATIAFVGSLITNPTQDNYASGKRSKGNETYVRQGRARLQDIWAYQNEDQDGLAHGERLSVVYLRKTKKMPRILDPMYQAVLQERRFYWAIEPISHIDFVPSRYCYCSDVHSADGGMFQGREVFIGTFLRDLTMQNHGSKAFYSLADAYLHDKNAIRSFEAYRQLRSIEIHTRQ